MRRLPARRALSTIAATAACTLAALAGPIGAGSGAVGDHLRCAAPRDAAALDRMLAAAGSPLAGEGQRFVDEASAIGLDPRALVAIAAHETMLATYGPAARIHNPFGLGPNWEFASYGDAIARAARTLDSLYLGQGLVGIPEIGAKWAPIGASNDPGGLNQHWANGVGTFYRALGADPERPVLLDEQAALTPCAAGAPQAPAAPTPSPDTRTPTVTGPPVITVWGGVEPAARAAGRDPSTGRPATIEGFVFPLALARGARADYRDTFSDPGPTPCNGARLDCSVTIDAEPGAPVVAMNAGVLSAASIADREEGIALWLTTAAGDRLAYGPLADYAQGIVPGARVAAGQTLGTNPGNLRVAWERAGVRIDPQPLLSATRAPVS